MRFRPVILFVVVQLCTLSAMAQRDERKVIKPIPLGGDTIKINRWVQQIFTLRETDPVRAARLCHETIALARQLGYQKGIAGATGSLGWIYFRQGDFVKALNYTVEALKISEKIGDKVEIGRCLNNLAGIYNEEREFELALSSLKRAYSVAVEAGDNRTIGRSLNNTALLYLEAWSNLDSSHAYAMKALAWSEKNKDDYNGAFSNRTLGDIAIRRGLPAKALEHYLKSLALSDNISNSLKVETWNRIAKAYADANMGAKALPILLRNVETCRKLEFVDELANSYRLLSEIYKKQGNVASAYYYLNEYTILSDSLFRERNTMQLATLQNQADLDLKQAEIELLLKDTELNKEEISRQQIKLYASIGATVAVLFIAGLLYHVNRKVRHANALLELRQEELRNKNRESELKSRELERQALELKLLNSTKDKLFSIIGHDFRSPLNSLKALLSLLENRNLDQEQFTEIAGILKTNLDSVSTTLENMLQLSLAQIQGIQTNPVRINMQELVEEHVRLFHELARAKGIRLENGISANTFAISDENHLRLVLRNLINNAIKFSLPGGVVRISNQAENPYIKILVADNGIGIEPDQLQSFFHKEKVLSREGTNQEKGMGIGLMLCQEFVENNGGRLTVASEPGKGSIFSFTLKAA